MRTSRILFSGAVAAIVAIAGCGGDPVSPPVAVATPTPAPSPTPTATPSPTVKSCTLTPMPECSEHGGGGCCRRENTDLYGEFVEAAILEVQRTYPELFNRDEIIHVYDEEFVVAQVARVLEQRYGLCAKPGSPVYDEVAVKGSNNFSEQFDIIFSNHRVNFYGYTVTCRPARF